MVEIAGGIILAAFIILIALPLAFAFVGWLIGQAIEVLRELIDGVRESSRTLMVVGVTIGACLVLGKIREVIAGATAHLDGPVGTTLRAVPLVILGLLALYGLWLRFRPLPPSKSARSNEQ